MAQSIDTDCNSRLKYLLCLKDGSQGTKQTVKYNLNTEACAKFGGGGSPH